MKAIFWIIGIVVLVLAIYWLWSAGVQGTPAPSSKDTTDNTTSQSLTVNLAAVSGSAQSGKAVLTEVNGKTQVVVTAASAAYSAAQPAHIHVGACPTPGAIKYPLTDLVAGTSTTTIDVTLAELKASLPLALNVHKSAAESSVYTACGDLKF